MEQSRLSRRITSRFVAGQTLPEAIQVVQTLSSQEIASTLDFLGEDVRDLCEASRSREAYFSALEQIRGLHLPATVSLKLTQFGLNLSEDVCRKNVAALAEMSRNMDGRVEIDMESSEYTDRTLSIVSDIQSRYPGNVRAVIQAYLYRSEADIRDLNRQSIPVRLCKGAYREPASVAIPRKADVDANYRKLMRLLLDEGTYPAIASHDGQIVHEALAYVHSRDLAPDRFEFQMLYGIRRDLQNEILRQGYRLRLYVPYGNAWYPYFMRRLAERPANVLFLAKNLVRR